MDRNEPPSELHSFLLCAIKNHVVYQSIFFWVWVYQIYGFMSSNPTIYTLLSHLTEFNVTKLQLIRNWKSFTAKSNFKLIRIAWIFRECWSNCFVAVVLIEFNSSCIWMSSLRLMIIIEFHENISAHFSEILSETRLLHISNIDPMESEPTKTINHEAWHFSRTSSRSFIEILISFVCH